jgi:hypothetical protein
LKWRYCDFYIFHRENAASAEAAFFFYAGITPYSMNICMDNNMEFEKKSDLLAEIFMIILKF